MVIDGPSCRTSPHMLRSPSKKMEVRDEPMTEHGSLLEFRQGWLRCGARKRCVQIRGNSEAARLPQAKAQLTG